MNGFLVLHGWCGSGPDHWQTWLAERLRERGERVRYPLLPDPESPALAGWLTALRAELDALKGTGERVVVCHSLAVLLWLHHAQQPGVGTVDRLLLVAPPGPSANNPQVESFFPAPLDPRALKHSAREILLVCTDADPYCPERAALIYGAPLGIETQLLPPAAGHINVAAGHGPWPWVEQWCRK